jgi:3-oxoacyl-[acyl-carrier-protein] synthase II
VNLASGYVSIKYNARGPNSATATACTTSAHSIGDSFRLVHHGYADAMICGGSEACITPMGIGGFAAMRALSTRNNEPERACRPWDKDRDGFIVGEGSGILVIEELEHAKRRGAPIVAEIVGYGMSSDAHHITSPPDDGDGAYRVMRNALRDAKVDPSQVQYVNAHGTSTEVGDRAETIALKRVFGDHAYKLAVSSTKSMTGHLLGGAGGLEAGVAVLALRDQIAPPTVNLDEPASNCDLDYVPHTARPMAIEYALSNSFGFGGTNGCLIFKRFPG